MSIRTSAKRMSEEGATEVVIMDGAVFVSIYRRGILIEERTYNAADLLEMDVDRILIRSTPAPQMRTPAFTTVV